MAAAKPRKRVRSLTVPCPFTIIQDTREQAPWGFAGIPCGSRHPDKTWAVTTRRQGLATGDYSIAGWEKLVCIERKSLPDLYHSIGAERDRFEREFLRMQAMNAAGGFAAVVIEADAGAAVNYPPPNTTIPPTVMLGTWAHWTLRYGVHWYFLPDRTAAEHFAFRLLEGFRRQKEKLVEELLS